MQIKEELKKIFHRFLNRSRAGKADDWVFLNLASFGVLGTLYSYDAYKKKNPFGLRVKDRLKKIFRG